MSLESAPPFFSCLYDADTTRAEISEQGVRLHMQMPLLGGAGELTTHVSGASVRENGDLLTMETEDLMVGFGLVEAATPLETVTRGIYSRLLEICGDRHLYRVWNYLPEINGDEDGTERYRKFNIGRWQAFENAFGDHLRSHLPSASAVGIGGEKLAIIFVAGNQPARHFENPEQVPAYHYPEAYGPRAPGFARASAVTGNACDLSFISGTASIRGHASIHPGNLPGQIDVMLDNLTIMGQQLDHQPLPPHDNGAISGIGDGWQLKCYLRHRRDYATARDLLTRRLGSVERVTFLQADICRRELDIEIEASRIVAGQGPAPSDPA